MKKRLVFIILLIFLCPLLFCEASFFLGGVYDSFQGKNWGLEGSIDADFMRNASLSAKIDYRYNNNYSMNFTAAYTPSIFLLGGGLDFKINKSGVFPGIKADVGFRIGTMLLFTIYGTLGINASNVKAPTMFELGTDIRFVSKYLALQLNGFYTQESGSSFLSRDLFAQTSMTIYKEGFLYSLKVGAIGEYTQDTRLPTNQKNLSFKGVVGVGKNKESGTFAIQFIFNVVTIIGPKTGGFAISIGKFPKKFSSIY